MRTADYDFDLPEGLVALRPSDQRDGSRLLVLGRDGSVEHAMFSDLPRFLAAGDMLVLNNTRVFPARITGRKPSGGGLDMLFVKESGPGRWEIISRGRYTGQVMMQDGVAATVHDGSLAVFDAGIDVRSVLWRSGVMPLPPYIRRAPDDADRERYQTVYAAEEGSIAAPTAGLHFTDELLERLKGDGILIRTVTLHVGTGTFRPVKADDLRLHVMDSEHFEFDKALMEDVRRVKETGRRVVAVGTTSTRALEAYAAGRYEPFSSNGRVGGSTDLFIYEGYRPKVVDSLVTNFHLPRSTPLMLTSAFAGREKLLSVYISAASMGYRFFSYGDAMLVL